MSEKVTHNDVNHRPALQKFAVKIESLSFSNGIETPFFTIKELDWLSDDEFDQIDEICGGVYFKGILFDYDNLVDNIGEDYNAEHIDTYDEDLIIFDNIGDAKTKYDELLNSTKTQKSEFKGNIEKGYVHKIDKINYYLCYKEMSLFSGNNHTIYYFGTKEQLSEDSEQCFMPDGKRVSINIENGNPYLTDDN